MSTVRLDSQRLAAARQAVSELAEQIEAQRHRVTRGTPVSLADLQDGGAAAQSAAWLEEQVAGLQSLEDLARCWRHGCTRRTTAAGSLPTPRAASARRSGASWTRSTPDAPQDLPSLTGIAGLLQRYSGDPVVENALIEEVGGSGLLDAFTSLVPVGPEPERRRGGPRLVARAHPGTAARGDAGAEPHLRQHRRDPGLARDLANRKNLPDYRAELYGMLGHPETFEPGEEPGTFEPVLRRRPRLRGGGEAACP